MVSADNDLERCRKRQQKTFNRPTVTIDMRSLNGIDCIVLSASIAIANSPDEDLAPGLGAAQAR